MYLSKTTKTIILYSIPLVANSIINIIYGSILINGYSHLDDDISIVVLAINSLNFLLLGTLGYLSSALQIKYKEFEDKNTLLTSSYVSAIFIWIILMIFIFIFGIAFIKYYYSFSDQLLGNARIYLVYTSVSVLFTLLTFITNAILKINEKTKVIGQVNIISSVVSLLVFTYVVRYNNSIVAVSLWSLVYPLVNFVITYFYMKYITKYKATVVNIKLIKDLLQLTLVMGAQELFDTSILLFFLESILANHNHQTYQSYLISMQILNYAMIPIYMVSSSLYTYLKSTEEDDQFYKSTVKINVTLYLITLVFMMLSINSIYLLFVPKRIPITLFTKMAIMLFAANLALPIYITIRTKAQCYNLADQLLVPTVIINGLTTVFMILMNIYNVPIYMYFTIIGINYLALTLMTSFYLKRRYYDN